MTGLEHRIVDAVLFFTKVATPLFVWVFGMTMAYVYWDHLDDPHRFPNLKRRVWKRALLVFLAHQFLVLVIDSYGGVPAEQVIERLLYRRLGYWIEVLNFYLFVLLVTPWILRWWKAAALWLRCVLVPLLYGLGTLLSTVEVPPGLFVLKEIVAGHPGSDTFPVLQFSSFYLAGLSFGRILSTQPHEAPSRPVYQRGVALAGVCALLSFVWSGATPVEYVKAIAADEYKFPAQPPYILLGMSGVLIVTMICLWVFAERKARNRVTDLIETMGRHSLLTFVLQYVVLFTLYGMLFGALGSSRLAGITLHSIVVLGVTAGAVSAWERIRPVVMKRLVRSRAA